MKEFKLDVTKIAGMGKFDGISGHLIIKVPSMKERLAMMKDSEIKSSNVGMDEVVKLMEASALCVSSVDVDYLGEKYTSFEDLGYYEFGSVIVNYVSGVVMNGIPLGKN